MAAVRPKRSGYVAEQSPFATRLSSSSVAAPAPAPASVSGRALSIRHGHFMDAQGRVQILRGVNLGGSSKLPTGYAHTNQLNSSQFFDGAKGVSFVNRPFPLKDADLHFARLRRWGLTFLRFIVTWEAIEHEGPGMYDREYLDYLRAIIAKSAEYGMQIYIDPHQDVWSRWTGGDGAPMWTLESVGLEPRHFEATKAALCLETCGRRASEFPKMIWPTNYFKFACATMFTLFWAGERFAPQCRVNGVQVQEYLQSHYCNAMSALSTALTGLPNIVGFGTMNEPSSGYIGLHDLAQHFHKGELKYGLAPTPFQGMCLAEGLPQTIERWSNGLNQHVLGRPDARQLVDPSGLRAWKLGYRCIWMEEGVWRIGTNGQPQLLKPDYFAGVDFGRDCYVPFAKRYIQAIRRVLPQAMLFAELPPLEFTTCDFPEIDPNEIPLAVNATHWYDGVTLFLRAWRPHFTVDPRTKMPAFGHQFVQKLHKRQLSLIKEFGRVQMHNAPTLIGETGIPFNLNDGRAFSTGNFTAQRNALNNTISCLEANLLSYTLWCYSSDNANGYGDLWNLEDLSLVSPDQVPQAEDPDDDDSCARALLAFARPHATRIAGIPQVSHFDMNRVRYELKYTSSHGKEGHEDIVAAPSEIMVPLVQYPLGYRVTLSDGQYEVETLDGYDRLLYTHDAKHGGMHHHVIIDSNDPAVEKRWKGQERQWFLMVTALIVLLVLIVYALAGLPLQ